jgi:hypothetical protein
MLEQVRGKVTPQRVQRYGLVDLGHLCRRMTGAVELACRERPHRIAPGKQPALWPRHLPLGPQQIEEMLRQHHVSVLTPLALLELDDHPGAFDVPNLERDDLRRAQSRSTPRGVLACRSRTVIWTGSEC